MDTSRSPQPGTVADRIRIFQDVRPIERKMPNFNLPPPTTALPHSVAEQRPSSIVLAESSNPRPSEPSEGSQDCVEDSPKSLPNTQHTSSQDPEQSTRPPLHPVLATNERRPTETPTQVNFHLPPAQPLHHRLAIKTRSMENMAGVADTSSSLVEARSRLRSVMDSTGRDSGVRSRAYTLAELNHLLDNAIEGNDGNDIFSATNGEDASGPSLVPRPHTAFATPTTSLVRKNNFRSSIDTLRPRSSEESGRVDYDDDKNSLYWPHLGIERTRKKLQVKKGTHSEPPAAPVQDPVKTNVVKQTAKMGTATQISPVRHKAAMFEKLDKRANFHDAACSNPQHMYPDSHPAKAKPVPIAKLHRIKFGDVIEERAGTPLIPLTLPSLVSPRADDSNGLHRPRNSSDESTHNPILEGKRSEHDSPRKSSVAWPFRWSIFNKPGTKEELSREPSTEDEVKLASINSSSERIVVANRVQDLVRAAKQRENTDKKKWEAERERMSRRHSRIPAVVNKESEPKHTPGDFHTFKPPQLPSSPVPPSDRLTDLQAAKHDLGQPTTPLHKAMNEKQVLPGPESTEDSQSPAKSTPHTPVRGRSKRSVHHLSLEDQEHSRVVEQQFNLDPRLSRSVSRNGGGVRVEVEVRDSPERAARERGEKIVIIRANVESLETT